MQAILTRYLPCTDRKGSRIKASCERGSIIVPYPWDAHVDSVPIEMDAQLGDPAHRFAAQALLDKFSKEDKAKYGVAPWSRPFISGGLPNGDWAHVFIK